MNVARMHGPHCYGASVAIGKTVIVASWITTAPWRRFFTRINSAPGFSCGAGPIFLAIWRNR